MIGSAHKELCATHCWPSGRFAERRYADSALGGARPSAKPGLDHIALRENDPTAKQLGTQMLP
ncbi:MAG: hypothetical protein JRI36_07150 [Deltaproteobacteria bacterium]|nr:hypothetical protein [Deltaproteobacteria bacterium]